MFITIKHYGYLLLFGYFIIINIIGFGSMGIDKRRARKGQWRIPEKTLFLIAMIGGSIGSILGMRHFRHKTQHISFKYGMPCILLIQVAIVGYLTIRFN